MEEEPAGDILAPFRHFLTRAFTWGARERVRPGADDLLSDC